MYLASLRRGLGNLARFSGRDRPGQFWPYAGAILGALMACWSVYFATLMGGLFSRMQAFAKAHPDQVTVEQGPGYYSMHVDGFHPELMPDFRTPLVLMTVIAAVFIVLVAAAAARRLHDSNVTGWVGLVPVVFLLSGLWMMSDLFGSIQVVKAPDFGRFFLLFGNNLLYLACLGGLVYLLVRRGTAGDNRYGPAPI